MKKVFLDLAEIVLLIASIVVSVSIIIFVSGYFQSVDDEDRSLKVCSSFESIELRDQCRLKIMNDKAEKNDR